MRPLMGWLCPRYLLKRCFGEFLAKEIDLSELDVQLYSGIVPRGAIAAPRSACTFQSTRSFRGVCR